jgi:phosphate transport system permease protein
VSEVALNDTAMRAEESASRASVLRRLRVTDNVFRGITRGSAIFVLVILSGVIASLVIGSLPALHAYGFSFVYTEVWNPVTEQFGALAPIYGTLVTSIIAMVIAVPVGIMVAFFLTELCPKWLRRPIAIAIELLAGIPSIIYGIWGLFVFAPFLQKYVQPFLIDTFEHVPGLSSLFEGPPYGIGILTAGLILAIMVLPFITAISRDVFDAVPPVLHHLGGLSLRHPALYARGRDRRRDAGPRPCARRNHGRHLRDRQRAQDLGLDPAARHDHFGCDRQ